MSTNIFLAIVTGIIGLLSAGILALINSGISARAGIDENLRPQRLKLYPKLWEASGAVSRWPQLDVTRTSLEGLHGTLRSWYYTEGGLFLSERARARYGDVQKLIAALLIHPGPPANILIRGRYTDLMETASALRTTLTEDLDTRRWKSHWEKLRRALWHAWAAHRARKRIKQAKAHHGEPFAPA